MSGRTQGLCPKEVCMQKLSLSLISSGRATDGQSYTEAERKLASNIAQAIGSAAGYFNKPCTDESINAIVDQTIDDRAALLGGKEDSLPSLCRAVYKKVEEAMLADKDTEVDFPKSKAGERAPRDWQSVNILFRGAFKVLGLEQAKIDQAFKPYRPAKKLG
jgi:hypothetical protein